MGIQDFLNKVDQVLSGVSDKIESAVNNNGINDKLNKGLEEIEKDIDKAIEAPNYEVPECDNTKTMEYNDIINSGVKTSSGVILTKQTDKEVMNNSNTLGNSESINNAVEMGETMFDKENKGYSENLIEPNENSELNTCENTGISGEYNCIKIEDRLFDK